MDKDEKALLIRMAEAQERMAAAIEKQKPGIAERFLATLALAASALGFVSAADIIARWIGG
jgi:uncharacterized Ntn-hydrolase superfamily protein